MNIQKSFYVAVRQVVSDFGSYLTEKQKSATAYEKKKPSERQEGSGAHKEQQHCLEATCKKLNKHTLLSGVLCLAAMNTILNVYWYKQTTNGQAWMQVQKPAQHAHTNTHQTKKPLDVSFTLSPKGPVHISNTQTIIEGGNFHYNTCFSIELTFQRVYVVKEWKLAQLSLFPFNP